MNGSGGNRSLNTSAFGLRLKRLTDILVSSVGLVVASPLMLVLAIIIKHQSPGAVLYRQDRVGYGGDRFVLVKFRSMVNDAESDEPVLTSKDDGRVTPIGRFMRKYHLDELPNLWNVIKGDMSLVGPRPEREFFIRQITTKAPDYPLVHSVRPGLTSLGIVEFGYASNVEEMVERSKYDMYYIRHLSPGLDMKIILRTIRTVMKGEGV